MEGNTVGPLRYSRDISIGCGDAVGGIPWWRLRVSGRGQGNTGGPVPMVWGRTGWFAHVMAVTERELAAILDHCRSLVGAAGELTSAAAARTDRATQALVRWEGEFRDQFIRRFDHEAEDIADRATGLRAEADAWASVWASAVNELNQQRRQVAVDRVRDDRGAGEQFVDFFVGDDSSEQVRAFVPVSAPTAATGFAPTGGLETW